MLHQPASLTLQFKKSTLPFPKHSCCSRLGSMIDILKIKAEMETVHSNGTAKLLCTHMLCLCLRCCQVLAATAVWTSAGPCV